MGGGHTFTQAPGGLDDCTTILPTLSPPGSSNFLNFANTLQFASPSCCYLLISPFGTGPPTAKVDLLTQMQERGEHWSPGHQEIEKKEALSSRHAGEDGVPVLLSTYISARYYILSNPHQDFSQSVTGLTRRYSSSDLGLEIRINFLSLDFPFFHPWGSRVLQFSCLVNQLFLPLPLDVISTWPEK